MNLAEEPEATFERVRPRLWSIAYRSLSSAADADDVVQEAWLRWHRTDQSLIVNPVGWLTAVTARLAIDRLRVRRRELDRYVGPWLPEPVPGDVVRFEIPDPIRTEDAVVDAAGLADDVTLGLLVVLERLDPVERVVLLLADVFDEPFPAIASIVGKTEGACRQIAVRARRRVRDEGRQRHRATEAERTHVGLAFAAAVGTGDIAALMQLIAPDAVLVSDGGPHRRAARRPVATPARIARFLINVTARLPASVTFRAAELNGEQGFVWEIDSPAGPLVDGAVVLSISDGLIVGVYMQVNRAKLGHLS